MNLLLRGFWLPPSRERNLVTANSLIELKKFDEPDYSIIPSSISTSTWRGSFMDRENADIAYQPWEFEDELRTSGY